MQNLGEVEELLRRQNQKYSKFLIEYDGQGRGGVKDDSPGSDLGNSWVPWPDKESEE